MMKSLILRPHLGCLSIVFEVVFLCASVVVVDRLFAAPGVNGFVMLAFLARWIYAGVTSPYRLLGPSGSEPGYMLVDPFEHQRDDANADAADAGSDAGGDTGCDAGSD
jgi:hypothetical protein